MFGLKRMKSSLDHRDEVLLMFAVLMIPLCTLSAITGV